MKYKIQVRQDMVGTCAFTYHGTVEVEGESWEQALEQCRQLDEDGEVNMFTEDSSIEILSSEAVGDPIFEPFPEED